MFRSQAEVGRLPPTRPFLAVLSDWPALLSPAAKEEVQNQRITIWHTGPPRTPCRIHVPLPPRWIDPGIRGRPRDALHVAGAPVRWSTPAGLNALACVVM